MDGFFFFPTFNDKDVKCYSPPVAENKTWRTAEEKLASEKFVSHHCSPVCGNTLRFCKDGAVIVLFLY